MIFKSGLNKARKGERREGGRANPSLRLDFGEATNMREERDRPDRQESFAYGINYHSEGVGLLLFETDC